MKWVLAFYPYSGSWGHLWLLRPLICVNRWLNWKWGLIMITPPSFWSHTPSVLFMYCKQTFLHAVLIYTNSTVTEIFINSYQRIKSSIFISNHINLSCLVIQQSNVHLYTFTLQINLIKIRSFTLSCFVMSLYRIFESGILCLL